MLISIPYKEGDVVSIKLSNGEEVIARYLGEESGKVIIDRPVVLQMGPKGAPALMPYFMTVTPDATKNIKLNANLVVMIASTDKPLADQYTSALSGIQVAPSGFQL
jgi:hypothetical protein